MEEGATLRYRRLTPQGDYTFGQGQGNFWIDQPEAVAQSVNTRLRLNLGEWFANTEDGTPWTIAVLGERTRSTRDLIVRERVGTTEGVSEIAAYSSVVDADTRTWTATMTIDTIYGRVSITAAKLPATVPPLPVKPAPAGRRATSLGIIA